MKTFVVNSRCECQAALSAVLDAQRNVLFASAMRRGGRDVAPAHTIHPHEPSGTSRFDVGWACPFCGRNVLRSFLVNALRESIETGSASRPSIETVAASAS